MEITIKVDRNTIQQALTTYLKSANPSAVLNIVAQAFFTEEQRVRTCRDVFPGLREQEADILKAVHLELVKLAAAISTMEDKLG